MTYEDLIRDAELFAGAGFPTAIVMSRQAKNWLRTHVPMSPATPQGDYRSPWPRTVLGTPVYDFPDVPESEVVAFRSQEVFRDYLHLREKIGHEAAVARLRAKVEPELIHVATLRALTEPT